MRAGVIDNAPRARLAVRIMRRHGKLRVLIAASVTFVVLTKLVSVPMRLAGAIISIVPVAGNVANDAIGHAANAIDDVPI